MSVDTIKQKATESTLALIKDTDGIKKITDAVTIQDGGNTITVDGSVTAAVSSIAAGSNVIGKVSIDQTTPGTTNAVVLKDTTGAELDFRQENENWNAADHGILVFGRDTASTPDKYRAMNMNAEGDIYVDISDINGAEPAVGNGAADTGTLRVTVASDSTGQIKLAAGSASIGTLGANSGTDIGDVTINNASGANAVNIQDGGNTITVDGTVAVTNADITSIKTAVEIMDDWDSGDTCKVTLQAGTAAVGALVPSDKDITGHTNYIRKYYTNAGAVTDGIVWSPAAGKRWHITSLYFQTSAAATITFEDDKAGGDDPVLKGEYAANSGLSITFDPLYPMASGEDAADLIVTTSAGNIYVTVVGYEI